jgi:hypothetical protein
MEHTRRLGHGFRAAPLTGGTPPALAVRVGSRHAERRLRAPAARISQSWGGTQMFQFCTGTLRIPRLPTRTRPHAWRHTAKCDGPALFQYFGKPVDGRALKELPSNARTSHPGCCHRLSIRLLTAACEDNRSVNDADTCSRDQQFASLLHLRGVIKEHGPEDQGAPGVGWQPVA